MPTVLTPEQKERRRVYARAYRSTPEYKTKSVEYRRKHRSSPTYNKQKHADKQREWYQLGGGKAKKRAARLQREYGLTEEQWTAMFLAQGEKCKICVTPEPSGLGWAVDHDHKTGEIRGILCQKCNQGLGLFGDNAAILAAAAGYLEGYFASTGP